MQDLLHLALICLRWFPTTSGDVPIERRPRRAARSFMRTSTLSIAPARSNVDVLKLEPPRFDLGEVEDVVDEREQMRAGLGMSSTYSRLLRVELPNMLRLRTSEKPMMEFSGVRSSCDMLARNSTCGGWPRALHRGHARLPFRRFELRRSFVDLLFSDRSESRNARFATSRRALASPRVLRVLESERPQNTTRPALPTAIRGQVDRGGGDFVGRKGRAGDEEAGAGRHDARRGNGQPQQDGRRHVRDRPDDGNERVRDRERERRQSHQAQRRARSATCQRSWNRRRGATGPRSRSGGRRRVPRR